MLHLDRVTCRAGGRTLLDDVSLAVEPGRILVLLGPSGGGKTTILRTAMGLMAPDAGRVRWADGDLAADGRILVPPERRGFAFLFQDFTLFPHLDVRRNILIGIRDLPKPERTARLERVCGLLGIAPLLGRSIHDLSGGEQQRVALARTLAMQPAVLLLDEPFSNLDRMARTGLYGEIRAAIRAAGCAAVLATHDHEEAFYFADRLAVIDGGRIVAEGDPAAIYRDPGSAWLARFTGEANILTPVQLAELAPGSDAGAAPAWLLRPEQIGVEVDPVGDAVVEEVAFAGRWTGLTVRTRGGLRLRTGVAGPAPCAAGAAVRLVLRGVPAGLRS
jgi:iron(III) transport system ATP-binding protein